jgi:TonB family protein
MRSIFVSIAIHVLILGIMSTDKLVSTDQRPNVDSSAEVIHLSFKLDEKEIGELTKKLAVVKKSERVAPRPSKTKKKVVKVLSKSAAQSVTARKKVSKIEGDKKLDQYFTELRKLVEQRKFYPKKALRMRQSGSVEICLEIDKNGNFHGIHIKTPSPFGSLNKAALSLVEEISRFKPLPKSLGKKITFNIPLKYALKN